MIPAQRCSTRLPGAAGTPQTVEVYRVAVRWPDGGLAYYASREQETELLANGIVDAVRSPSGLLRHLRLNRDWRLLRADSLFARIVTRHLQSGMRWQQQAANAKTGLSGSFARINFSSTAE